jgi:hypothetical protein
MQFFQQRFANSFRKFVALLATSALIGLCSAGAQASALGDAANSMEPGEWLQFSTSNFNDSTLNESGPIFVYAEEMKWDKQRGEMQFVGAYHYQTVVHLVYSEATNSWGRRSIGGVLGMPFHGYDHMALSDTTRTFYVRPFGAGGNKLQRYNLDTQQWSASASFSGPVQDAVGIEWFPELNKVVYIDEYAVRLYDPASNSWSTALENPAGLGPYHNFAEYSSKHKVMIMGGGNGSRAVWRMNSSGQITRLADAPIEVGVMSSIVTTDPVSGNFLVFGKDQSYEFNPVSNAWTRIATPPFVTLSNEYPHVQYAVAGAIPTYGVVMVAKYDGSGSRVYLYKHSPSAPVIAPKAPTNVTAQ